MLDNVMRPRFRAGDFSGGIEQGVGAILDTLGGQEVEALTSEPPPQNQMPITGRVIGLVIFTINVGLFSIIAIFSSGFGSWFLYFFLMPFYFLFPMFLIRMEAGPIMFGLLVDRLSDPEIPDDLGVREGLPRAASAAQEGLQGWRDLELEFGWRWWQRLFWWWRRVLRRRRELRRWRFVGELVDDDRSGHGPSA